MAVLVAGEADTCPRPLKRDAGVPVMPAPGSNFGVAELEDTPGAIKPPKRDGSPGADGSPSPLMRELGVVVVPAPIENMGDARVEENIPATVVNMGGAEPQEDKPGPALEIPDAGGT